MKNYRSANMVDYKNCLFLTKQLMWLFQSLESTSKFRDYMKTISLLFLYTRLWYLSNKRNSYYTNLRQGKIIELEVGVFLSPKRKGTLTEFCVKKFFFQISIKNDGNWSENNEYQFLWFLSSFIGSIEDLDDKKCLKSSLKTEKLYL